MMLSTELTNEVDLETDYWVFVTNGDGTFNCEWCESVVPVEEAQPDGDLNPICRACQLEAEADFEFYEELDANTASNS